MVNPTEVKFDDSIVISEISRIDDLLRKGETDIFIACNENLLKGILKEYKDDWVMLVKKYQSKIRITFRVKEDQISIIIKESDHD